MGSEVLGASLCSIFMLEVASGPWGTVVSLVILWDVAMIGLDGNAEEIVTINYGLRFSK